MAKAVWFYASSTVGHRPDIRYFIVLLALSLVLLNSTSTFARIPGVVDGQPLPSLAPMLEQVTPAVVNISTRSIVRRDSSLEDFYRFFYGAEPPAARESEPQSLGSGVIVDAELGLVVTNFHVIDGADEVIVTLRDGREPVAKILGTDPKADIALLQIESRNLTAARWADSDSLRVGDFCIAIGNPFGLGQTVTSGIVSALRRSGLGIEDFEDFIQTDASINPGNSGGALVNLRGELIGINTAIVGPSGGNVGIGFAIPSNMAQDIIDQLLQFGRVKRGKLGISAHAITPDLVERFNLSRERGVLIVQVEQDSPADIADLRPGDIITAIDGQRMRTVESVINRLGLVRLGQDINVRIVRDGREFDVIATVAESKISDSWFAGAEFLERQTSRGRKYVAISKLESQSLLASRGLQRDDIVLSVNREPVETVADIQTHGDADEVLLFVQRGQDTSYIRVQ